MIRRFRYLNTLTHTLSPPVFLLAATDERVSGLADSHRLGFRLPL